MRTRKFVAIMAAALGVLALSASSAFAADQSPSLATGKPDPTDVVAGKSTPGAVFVDSVNCRATDATCISSGGTNPQAGIDGVIATQLDFSPEMVFNSGNIKKAPACSTATIQSLATPKDVQKACSGGIFGSGEATACVAAPDDPCPAGLKGPWPVLLVNGGYAVPPSTSINKGKATPNIKIYANVAPLGPAGRAVYDGWLLKADTSAVAAGYKTSLLIPGSGNPGVGVTDLWANVTAALVKIKCGTIGQVSGSVNMKVRNNWIINETGGPTPYSDTKTTACNYHTP